MPTGLRTRIWAMTSPLFLLEAGRAREQATDGLVQLGQHRTLDADRDRLHGLCASDAMDDERAGELLGRLVDGGEAAHLEELPRIRHGGHLTIGPPWLSPWTSARRRPARAPTPSTSGPSPPSTTRYPTSRASPPTAASSTIPESFSPPSPPAWTPSARAPGARPCAPWASPPSGTAPRLHSSPARRGVAAGGPGRSAALARAPGCGPRRGSRSRRRGRRRARNRWLRLPRAARSRAQRRPLRRASRRHRRRTASAT